MSKHSLEKRRKYTYTQCVNQHILNIVSVVLSLYTCEIASVSNSRITHFLFQSAVPRLVVAIDFGSFASGYAYQYRSEFERDPLLIHINTQWEHGGLWTNKTRTALLLKVLILISE